MTGQALSDPEESATHHAAPRFYCAPGPQATDVGAQWTLPDAVAHHAVRVLRLVPRDGLTLFTGEGGEYAATLVRVEKRLTVVRIDAFDAVERESPLATVLVQALCATDAMDYAVRKAVEAGVTAIQPVTTQRSARFPDGERGEKRLAHWRQIVIAASEQCGRNRLAEVRPVVSLAQWLMMRNRNAVGLVLTPDGVTDIERVATQSTLVELLIGPEGGLAAREIADARASGMFALKLGPRVLRTETAGVATLAVLQSRWGDWR